MISVYSDAGPQVATQTLNRIRTMAALFQEFGRPAIQRPVRVLVFRSSSEFEQYRPSAISAGFFQSGAEGDWIAFPATAGNRVLLHEFTHLLLHRVTGPLPQWLEEGLAEFFSTTRIQAGVADFGLPIPEHQRNLQLFSPLSAAELTAARQTGIHYQDPQQAARFYATSWILVHMLYSEPRYAANMPAFVQAMDRLTTDSPSLPDLFRATFGVTMDQALAEARERAAHPTLGNGPRRRVQTGDLASPPLSAPAPLTIADAASLQAELLLDCGKPTAAASKYESLVRSAQSPAIRAASAGYLALAQGDTASAISNFHRAMEAGSSDARVVLEYAMLLRDQQGPASRAAVTQLLEKAASLDPNFAEVLFLLGVRATDRKDYQTAISYLQHAATILPRQSSFWHALGFAQAKAGDLHSARQSANRALRAATTAEQEEMARGLLDLEGMSSPPRNATSQPKVVTGKGWQNPQADARSRGVLHDLDCSATPSPQLSVRTPTGDLETFSMNNPRQIRIEGDSGPSIEWKCGKMDPRAVEVEYLRSSRELVILRFLP